MWSLKSKVYRLLKHPKSADILGCWKPHLGSFNEVVGYTVTGAVILRASESQDYLALYPLKRGNNSKNYGHFSSLKQFEADILQEENFASSCLYPLKPDDIPILKKRLGSLGKEQAYFPVPNTWIGGSWDLKSFDKGNVWIFVDIAGQSRGFSNPSGSKSTPIP